PRRARARNDARGPADRQLAALRVRVCAGRGRGAVMAERRFDKLLVLDLDETLIHARSRGEADLPWPPQRQIAHFRVYLRPGVQAFMAEVLERFAAVGVWTSASADYAVAMLDRIVARERLRFIYARDRCTQR